MRAHLAAAALLGLAALVISLPNRPEGRTPDEDAGVFLYMGSLILSGGAPYVDAWDHKPPGVHLAAALGLGLGGRDGVWAVEVFALAVAALFGYFALARAFGTGPAAVASVAWLAAMPRLFIVEGRTTAFAEFFAPPLQFASLFLLVQRRTRAADVAIGACAGAALLLKPTVLGMWIAIALVALVPLVREASWRALLGRAGWLTLGAALPLAVALLFVASRGALAEMWDQAVWYNVANSRTATLADRLEAARTGLRLTASAGLIVLAALGWCVAAGWLARGARPGPRRDLVAVALIAAPLEIVLATGSGRPYHYYYIPWVAPLAVLAAALAWAGAGALRERFGPRWAAIALIGSAAVLTIRPAAFVADHGAAGEDGVDRAAVRYLAEQTRPGDTVLIWGARTGVNFLADRRAPTRFTYQYGPLLTVGYSTAAHVEELARDIERRRPVLIFDESATGPFTPPLDRAALRSWTSPDPRYAPPPGLERVLDVLESRYERAGVMPQTGWPVWRLRVAVSSSAAAGVQDEIRDQRDDKEHRDEDHAREPSQNQPFDEPAPSTPAEHHESEGPG